MHLEYILQAHGLTGRGGSKQTPLPDVVNFTATSKLDGTAIDLSWSNTELVEYTKTEIFVSTSNIENANYDYCSLNATKIVDSKATSFSYANVSRDTTYYFKAFMTFNSIGEIRHSGGVGVSCLVVDTTPPNTITNFTVEKEESGFVKLSWKNPTDTDFNRVKIMYKTSSYPTSHIDGTLGYEGSATSVSISELTNDTKYYFRAFTFDNSGNINSETVNQQVEATPSDFKIYGVKIDTLNSNPYSAVTYIDDAIGLTEAFCNNGDWQMGDWADKFPFNMIKPCVVKNGAVNYYLNPNDYTKKENGTPSDITSGTDGDVMVEFPKIYWKFERIGGDLFVRYSDKRADNGYKCLAHTVGSVEKDKIYISAYKGYSLGGKLRSLSGKAPTSSQTIGQFRTLAQANGSGYQQFCYYPMLMLQVLALIIGKNRDTQTSLGRGYVDGNSSATNTGGANTKGMFYGETTGKQQNKFCGVEDFYGNVFDWVDGLYSDSAWNIMISNQTVFNDNGNGYVNQGKGATANIGGWIGDVQGTTETGFIVKTTNGSATTHYSDYGALTSGSLGRYGGYWTYGEDAGAFYLYVDYSASSSSANLGSRLCVLG